MIALEISSRNARVAALQKRRDRLRAGLDLILDQRAADMVDLPGGASGLLVRDYNGKEADREVYRADPGVASLVAELRGKRQAAEEPDQRKAHHEERKVTDASLAAITLVLLLTDEELDSLEKTDGDRQIARRGRPGGSNVASPQPPSGDGEPAQVLPANAVAADGRPGLDGVIGGSRIRAVAGGAADGRPSSSWARTWPICRAAPAGCTRARKPIGW